MKVEHFDTPSSRTEFERSLNLLGEELNQGRFRVAPGLSHSIEGLRRVRYLPNHRLDLLTVDESARLKANMMARFLNLGPAALQATPVDGALVNGDDADEADE